MKLGSEFDVFAASKWLAELKRTYAKTLGNGAAWLSSGPALSPLVNISQCRIVVAICIAFSQHVTFTLRTRTSTLLYKWFGSERRTDIFSARGGGNFFVRQGMQRC